LTSIEVEEGNPSFDSRDKCNAIIEKDRDMLLYGCSTTVIPNSVKIICTCAFEGCSDLSSVDFPESLTNIYGCAFQGCSGLTSIFIPKGLTDISDSAFVGCSGLTSIVVEEGNPKYD
jgi:hypothetical protein